MISTELYLMSRTDIFVNVIKCYKATYREKLCGVYLYGSYARGDQDSESDIDIVAIVDDERINVQKKLKQVWEDTADVGLEYDVIVSLLAIPLSDFRDYENTLPLYKNIRNEGVRIYQNEQRDCDDKSYLENNLPNYLLHSIEKMKIAWLFKEADPSYTFWEGEYYELQSDINIAVLSKNITMKQAWYLREKYLRILKCDEFGEPVGLV